VSSLLKDCRDVAFYPVGRRCGSVELGLGLLLVRYVVSTRRDVWARSLSNQGSGSVFRFRRPKEEWPESQQGAKADKC
jgi:hypothetical protein